MVRLGPASKALTSSQCHWTQSWFQVSVASITKRSYRLKKNFSKKSRIKVRLKRFHSIKSSLNLACRQSMRNNLSLDKNRQSSSNLISLAPCKDRTVIQLLSRKRTINLRLILRQRAPTKCIASNENPPLPRLHSKRPSTSIQIVVHQSSASSSILRSRWSHSSRDQCLTFSSQVHLSNRHAVLTSKVSYQCILLMIYLII